MTKGQTMTDYSALTAAIQGLDFDTPFTLYTDGTLTTARWAHAPEVYHVEGADGVHHPDIDCGDIWYPILHGYSNQDGYRGAIMHASEQVSQGIVGRLLSHAEALDGSATFVIVAVEVLPEMGTPEADFGAEPAGWTILARPTTYGAED